MAKTLLRTAAFAALVLWALIWVLFMGVRFSSLDVAALPVFHVLLPLALVCVLLAPVMAVGLAAAALIWKPRLLKDWIALGCAVAAVFGQTFLFLVSRWL
jgi:hypothetical protein